MIEFVLAHFEINNENKKECEEKCNRILKRKNVGYRLMGNKFVAITTDEEIEEIKNALENPLESIRKHITRVSELLSDREQPDYRNSIKESISVIESICEKIVADDKTTLGKVLNKIEKKGLIFMKI